MSAPARRQRRRRLARRGLVLLVLGGVLGALRLRGRLAALRTVEPVAPGSADDAEADDTAADRWALLTAEGVVVDPTTRREAVAHAEAEGLLALDLVPGDLPAERAMDLARLVDPGPFRQARLAAGHSARQATLVRRDLLERAGIDQTDELDPVTYARTALTLKRYAPTGVDLAVAPDLASAPSADDPDKRLALLSALFGPAAAAAMGLPGLAYLALGVGTLVNPLWGALAVAGWSALPVLATAATPLHPKDLPGHAARRIVDEPRHWLRTLTGRWRPPRQPDPAEALRPTYAELVAEGTDRFLEPRRDDCPWCGSTDLAVRITAPDRFQFKPGHFTMEECRTCGHTFQNPRLSLEGLDYYYRDFYDGLSEDQFDAIFAVGAGLEHDRAEMLRGVHEPRRWLDVGTGHGHFALLAAERWPDTTFEGLDLGESVEEAARRGWIAKAHRGLLPDLAPRLAGSFDVVSMHHELEHTRDPRAELAAAAEVLEPGGYLEIEVPDPEYPLSRLLRGLWLPFFQPQHQHMVPVGNLCGALEDLGFEIVTVVRAGCQRNVDLTFVAWFGLNRLAPPTDLPWLPRGSGLSGVKRALVFAAGLPLLAVAAVADQVAGLVARATNRGNAYRVLARKTA